MKKKHDGKEALERLVEEALKKLGVESIDEGWKVLKGLEKKKNGN